VTNDLVRIAFKIAFPFRKSGRCKGRCPMNNAPPATLKPKVERFLPVISTLKQFQWQYAWHLFMHQTSIFLMMPCGSGKTYIYIALSIILWFASLNAKKSNRVIIVYAPLNEIIRGQIELVRSMHGTSEGTRYCWHAWNYADNPTEVKHALTTTTLDHPTVIFYNPHETTCEAFEGLIKESVNDRIASMVFDEAGTVVDWGLGDLFRPVLRTLRRFIIACQNKYNHEISYIVYTGAASIDTRRAIDKIFLREGTTWGCEQIESPLTHCHVSLNVTVVQTRERETNLIQRGLARAATEHAPPAKFLVLVPFVKNLQKVGLQGTNAMNPDLNLPIIERVVTVFADEECVGGASDMARFRRGGVANGDTLQRGHLPRTLASTYGMVSTGFNVAGICEGWGKGQPHNVDMLIQSWFRCGRGGMPVARFNLIVSWFHFLELKYHAYRALTASESSDATREHATLQAAQIDEITLLLMFPDGNCLVQSIDALIMGTTSIKRCSVRCPQSRAKWCSSCCVASVGSGAVVHELQTFIRKWCEEDERRKEPIAQKWSELLNGDGDCIQGVPAGCIAAFIRDQGIKIPSKSNRLKNINLIRRMIHPIRIKLTTVTNILKNILPSVDTLTTVQCIQAALMEAVKDASKPIEMVKECVQRLILKQVLKSRPPVSATTKEQAAAHPEQWLVSRGRLFLDLRNWPNLQLPARKTSRVSKRQENRAAQPPPPKKAKKNNNKKKKNNNTNNKKKK
jgi:hypothetical protein